MILKVGTEYNLNNVKEIKVTDQFLSMDKTTRNCQNDESQQDCKTRELIEALEGQCKCFPFAITDNAKLKVIIYLIIIAYVLIIHMY